jgi:acetyl esterase/lipase
MSLEERDAILALLAARQPAPDLDARRAGFETLARALWPGVEVPAAFELVPGLAARWAPAPPSASQPVLLWLHGGAFTLGSSASHWPLAAEIARMSGHAVLLPDYALAPERPFPAALDDTLAALDWLAALGARPLAIGGDSAGGNLAVAALQAQRAGPAVPVGACWLMSPYLDLAHTGASLRLRRPRDRFVNPDDGTNIRYAAGTALADPRVSPLLGPVEAFPPTLLQVGTEEVLYDDARRFAERLWAAWREADVQAWEGMMHVWPLFAPRLEEGRWAIAQGSTFLRRILEA